VLADSLREIKNRLGPSQKTTSWQTKESNPPFPGIDRDCCGRSSPALTALTIIEVVYGYSCIVGRFLFGQLRAIRCKSAPHSIQPLAGFPLLSLLRGVQATIPARHNAGKARVANES